MKKIGTIILLNFIAIIYMTTNVNAHGGNITGWKDKNSDKVIKHNGKNYEYHSQDGVRHFHEVVWNEQEQKWEIVKTAICYDENFNIINNSKNDKTEKIEVEFSDSVDGDTAKFKLKNKIITVRFLGIDTPETVHPNKGEEPYGKEASNFTKEKLENAKKIEIEYDTNSAKTDKYERHLAWIWVDDCLVQEELVKNGLAKTYMLQDNYKYAGILQENEYNAKQSKLGIWSNEDLNKIPEETNKNETNEITKELSTIIVVIFIIIISMLKSSLKSKKRRRK